MVDLAEEFAEKSGDRSRKNSPFEKEALVERSRLAKEDTLSHESMTKAERKWLRQNRPPKARHWKLLTGLDVRDLAYAGPESDMDSLCLLWSVNGRIVVDL